MKHLKIPRPSQQLQRQVVNASQAGWGAESGGGKRPSPKIGWWSPWQYWYQAGRLAMASGLSWRCCRDVAWDGDVVVLWWRGSLRMGRYYDLRDFLMGNTPCLTYQSMLVSETRNGNCTPIYGNLNRKYDDGMWIWDILYQCTIFSDKPVCMGQKSTKSQEPEPQYLWSSSAEVAR